MTAGARQYHATNGIVEFYLIKQFIHLGPHLHGQGVACLGPVHGHYGDAIADVHLKISHGFLSFRNILDEKYFCG